MPSHAHVEGCARLNVMRLNAARLNFYESIPLAVIGGADRSNNVRIAGAGVGHVLNEAPDTLHVRVEGFVPVAGQAIALYSGDRQLGQQLFGGRIIETTALYESLPANVAYDIRGIDPTWLLNRQRVLRRYVSLYAHHIISDIMATFTRGFAYWTHITIPPIIVDEISFTNETVASCLNALCERIGAYWYVDYAYNLHVFLQEDMDAAPITDAEPRGLRDHTLTEDLSQVVTRIIARGGSGSIAVDLPAGVTELPVKDEAGWFSTSGGIAEVAAQRITYTALRGLGGTGSLIGQAITPTAAPKATATANINLGAALQAGYYYYAFTYANAVGETLPGPWATVYAGASAPTLAKTQVRPGYYQDYQGKTTGGSYSWRIALFYNGGGWALGPPTDYVTVNDRRYEIQVGLATIDPATGNAYYPALTSGGFGSIASTYVYRTTNGGGSWFLEKSWSGVVTVANGWLPTDNQITDEDLGGMSPYPSGPIATFAAVHLSAYPALPTQFTTRKLYRTPAGGGALMLRATNPPEPLVDTDSDATLGALAPSVDTSGVAAPSDQILAAGTTTIPVTDTSSFAADGGATGGWVQIGNLVVRYTGLGAAALTGIPPTGSGALTATLRHGAQVLVQPRLIGLPASGAGALTASVKIGDPITIRVELDDPAAQAALGARLGGTAADGLVEEPFSDSRMTTAELLNYARALLLDRKDPVQTVRFVSRDATLEVGRLITLTLTTPPIVGTFRIQRITFTEIAITGGLARVAPLRTVEASTKLYTFADLLRRMRGREGGAG